MTSRPTAGIQRQPQRSLSGTGITQRPVVQRSLSQQYSLSTPIRKAENGTDLASNGSENGRYGTSRLGGSRLKIEMSKGTMDAPVLVDPPRNVSAAQTIETIRGRPRLRYEADSHHFRVSHGSTHLSSIRGVENSTTTNPIPMPRRPVQSAPPFARGERGPIAVAIKKEVRPKPYVLEVPSAAPHFQPNVYADFFPWTGEHPEDLFNDHVIRQGFFDKSQTTQNETGSAKLSIFPAVKHKSGLHTLSSLFTTVLSQRRTYGQITSSPTFKPPPRVTLTDTKRETWLRDLANSNIPLRRLSRTIPHGIRGKVLLEQCLSKQIPTERAVWLAKCVGANEIRSFKRKGVNGIFSMGGEAKWIRDWTVFVEQFVESVVASCGDNDWKARVIYAIRLGVHLYSEHLMDREHYMDWLSLSLESCSLAKAPIWLLITQLYWSDLLSSRKFGCRIVAAMCAHLHAIHESPDQDLLLPLTERITSLLKRLIETHGENFISPKFWGNYNTVLSRYLFLDNEHPSPKYRSINQRNMRLSASRAKTILSPHRLLIGLLDKSLFRPYPSDLPQECRQVVPELSVLARTVLEWCTSPHRPGAAKIYVAARLLRVWGRSEVDVNEAVLDFLGSRVYSPGLCKPSFYHLISELARSGHFSISKYIQWLVARGGLRGPADLVEDGPCATRLLAELPIHELPESIARLRHTMLTRISTSMNDELQEMRAQIGVLEKFLSKAANLPEHDLGAENFLRSQESVADRSSLNRAIKSEIGVWVRKRASLYIIPLATAPQSDWGGEKTNDIELTITPIEFNLMRGVLEDIEDFSMLADVLKMVTYSGDPQILASAADTLCLHTEVFAAIGALNDLFDKLLTRLRSLPPGSDGTAFQRSLFYLAGRLPGAESVALQLSQELLQSSQRTAADACSPVSDHMTEVLDNSESQFSDEIEKMMASGTSMDLATLRRLFGMITLRIEVSWGNGASQLLNCAVLLSRLRCFGVKHFELLMAAWLQRMLQTSKRPSLVDVLGHLISVDCLDFREVITSTAKFLDGSLGSENPSTASKVAVETLALLLGTSHETNTMTVDYHYHLCIRRLLVQSNHPSEVLSVIRRAIELSGPLAEYDFDTLSSLCRSKRMCRLLRQIVLKDLDIVIRELVTPLAKCLCPKSRIQLGQLIKRLLEPDYDKDILEHTMADRIEHIIHLADDLTLPFCHLELQFILTAEVPETSTDENDTLEHLEAFERAVDSAVANDNSSWASIVPTLDIQIARHLCQRAERLLLQLVPSIRVEDYSVATSTENENLAKRLLFIVHATSYSMQINRTSYVALQIVERLNDIWQIFSQGDAFVRTSVIDVWLPLLLDFIIFHVEMFDTSKTSSELRSRILLTLSVLLLELQTRPDIKSTLAEQVFDVSIFLVDDLSEDARQNCIKSLKDKTSDPRIRYIFGYSRPSMDWMQLSQKGKLMPYPLRRWEILSEPTPNVGENDTSLSLTLFGGRKE